MAKRGYEWRRVRALTKEEKSGISAACERFISEILKPRFLPEIRPTEFNYCIDIYGRWRAGNYSFIQRYRSGFPEYRGEDSTRPSPASIIATTSPMRSGST